MDKRTILAVALSMVIFIGWQKFYLEPIQEKNRIYQEQQEALKKKEMAANGSVDAGLAPSAGAGFAGANSSASVMVGENSQARNFEEKNVTLENKLSRVTLGNGSSRIKLWELKGYTENSEEISGFLNQNRIRFSDVEMSKELFLTPATFSKTSDRVAEFVRENNSVIIKERFSLDENGYGGDISYHVTFKKEPPKYVFVDQFGNPKRKNDKEGSIFGQAPDKVNFSYRNKGGRQTVIAGKMKAPVEEEVGVNWFGVETKYFALAMVPSENIRDSLGVQIKEDTWSGQDAVRGTLAYRSEGKKEVKLGFRSYFGPKQLDLLKAADPMLTDAVDFGYFTAIALPLLQALKWLYSFVGNYGVAIILLTFLIKVALMPLTYKSMTSMAKMAKLQPQLTALREKYKDDKEKLNVEMMGFMKSNGYNPIGGCLPMILQMPIFFALYRVLFNSMELYHQPFVFWIHDLSAPDRFFVTPVLLAGLMFLQQKLTPNTAADPAQQKMMQFMPLMFGSFMLMLPAGLNIYMVVNSGTSIAQQYILNRRLGIGRFAQTPVKA